MADSINPPLTDTDIDIDNMLIAIARVDNRRLFGGRHLEHQRSGDVSNNERTCRPTDVIGL